MVLGCLIKVARLCIMKPLMPLLHQAERVCCCTYVKYPTTFVASAEPSLGSSKIQDCHVLLYIQ